MGNGCWSGNGVNETGRNEGVNRRWFRLGTTGAVVTLLLAGAILLSLGSRRATDLNLAQLPAYSFPGSHPVASKVHPGLRSTPAAQAVLGQLPLIFEPNLGQGNAATKFMAHGPGYGLSLDASGAVLGVQVAGSSPGKNREQLVRMRLVGANPKAEMAGTSLLPGKTNYLVGSDPHRWRTGIPQFAGVRYQSIYPGVDLVFYGSQGHLEYDFHIAPGADPSRAELQFEGAGRLQIKDGDLLVGGSSEANSAKNTAILRMR
jgi:hypothetical protein